jgi:uncharacterized protein (TIGR02265 family)
MSQPAEQVVFEQTVEGLLRAIRPRLTPSCQVRLKAAGLDVDAKLLPAYAFDVWMKCLLVSAEELWPHEPREQALFRVGEAFIEGYRETFMGRAVLGVIRVIGPRRALQRATRSFRSGNNYTEATVSEVSDTCLELWMNEVGPYPSFTQGLIEAALRASGVAPDVEIKNYDGHGCTYRCSWVLTS